MSSRVPLALVVCVVLAFPIGIGTAAGSAPPYPVLPVAEQDSFLSGLAAPTLPPGGSGALSLRLTDPLPGPLLGIALDLEVYAFNGFPGNATGATLSGPVPVLSGGTTNGSITTISIGRLGPAATYRVPGNLSISVLVPPGTPAGTFAVRLALSFTEGGQSYRLASRGYFSANAWQNATIVPNGTSGGTPTLNDTRLGVSGIVPETAIYVETPSLAPTLYAILGGSVLLAATGGYLAWRRGPGSRSGRWAPRDPQRAPRALGKRRSREGD